MAARGAGVALLTAALCLRCAAEGAGARGGGPLRSTPRGARAAARGAPGGARKGQAGLLRAAESTGRPLLLFVSVLSANASFRNALRDTWLSLSSRPGDLHAASLAPRRGELSYRFFVDSPQPEEQRLHGDIVPLRTPDGEWSRWLTSAWRSRYPPSLIFKPAALTEYDKTGKDVKNKSARDEEGPPRCWYNGKMPHCHKDFVVEMMRWAARNLRMLHWLVVDEDSVVCMPNLLHQLRILPAPGQPGYQPFTVGRGVFAHGLFDQCFILMSAAIVAAIVDGWYPALRAGDEGQPNEDCCMFGDSFSSHRGCTAAQGGMVDLGYECCRPCVQGRPYAIVEQLRRRGLDLFKWWWGAPHHLTQPRSGVDWWRYLNCSGVPGLGELWARGVDCPQHPCSGLYPLDPERHHVPSRCSMAVSHEGHSQVWTFRAHALRRMMRKGEKGDAVLCDGSFFGPDEKFTDCSGARQCSALREALGWCHSRLFLHKVKKPAAVRILWRLTHGERAQRYLGPGSPWRFRNLSTSPVFGWSREAAWASKVRRHPGGGVSAYGRSRRRTWSWDGTC